MSNLYRPSPSWQREHKYTTNVVNDPLAVIYNEGQWRLNKVSPMYNLQYDPKKLKQYASKVRRAIVSGVAANTSTKYTVKFEEQFHLKYSEDDANGLMITVSSTQENNKNTKVAYAAVLLSWGVSTSLANATHLPYMLDRGEQKVGSVVKTSLQTMFDCNVTQFSFTQHQLLELGFNFVESVTARDNEQFVLVYKTQQQDLKDKLSINFDIEDVKIIWNGVQEEVNKKSELVNLAHQILQNQIFHMIDLDIGMFDLCSVGTSKAEVKSSGVVKMKSPEVVNCVFLLLNDITDFNCTKELNDTST